MVTLTWYVSTYKVHELYQTLPDSGFIVDWMVLKLSFFKAVGIRHEVKVWNPKFSWRWLIDDEDL